MPTFLAAAALAMAFAGSVVVLRRERQTTTVGLAELLGVGAAGDTEVALAEPVEGSFGARVVRPMVSGLARRIGRLTPGGHLDAVQLKLVRAGLAGRVRAEEVVAAEVAAVIGGALLALAFVVTGDPAPRIALGMFVLLPVCGLLAVQSWLARAVTERRAAIQRDLPEVLDLLSLSVQAGLGFEAAMALVADRLPSPLSAELGATLRDMDVGRTRQEAFANLKRRTDVPALNGFVSAIIQADALGVPIGRVLSSQAAEMRLRRRQWAREQAAKLPVKVLFPTLVFVFPAMFVVILGPAVGPLRDALQ